MSAGRFGRRTLTARVRHRCANCWGWIAPGAVYGREVYADGGVLQTVKYHPQCASMAAEIGYDDGESFDWGEFRQDCHAYCVGPFPWEGA